MLINKGTNQLILTPTKFFETKSFVDIIPSTPQKYTIMYVLCMLNMMPCHSSLFFFVCKRFTKDFYLKNTIPPQP